MPVLRSSACSSASLTGQARQVLSGGYVFGLANKNNKEWCLLNPALLIYFVIGPFAQHLDA